ncbi:MAG TPA: hypothetical protein VN957_27395 [Chthoniobacterales bacterium]|nr:hypothetical protein [Chthoniobacterales bacterium]
MTTEPIRQAQDESEQLIELISEETSSLLRDHWADIQTYRDDDADIKISLAHRLSYDGSQRMVKTVITFSHRVKDEIEQSFNTAQADLPLKVTIQKRETKK